MSTNSEIGARVRTALRDRSQVWLSGQIGKPTDVVSRSLNGLRAFSSVEIAKIANALDEDVHWLITGDRDPLRFTLAARHNFNPHTGERSNPGRGSDEETLQAVALAYKQAYPDADRKTQPIPTTADAVREALGDDFVLDFADRLEERLDVDVIRVQHLSTAYSFTLGGRMAILLPATFNWWRSNFGLAHEVAHLALRHHDVTSGSEVDTREAAANQFASELLMPESAIRAIDWSEISGAKVAQLLWDWGIGTRPLAIRLETLGISTSPEVVGMLTRTMPGALRPWQRELKLPAPDSGGVSSDVPYDPIDERMQNASQRRFPLSLVSAHRQRIEDTGLNPASLAWMLESPVEDLTDEHPSAGSIEELLASFDD